ncbi:MAG: hypothetical protein Q8R30_02160 [bacterium]|nr:hypothetical protein [bacterium]
MPLPALYRSGVQFLEMPLDEFGKLADVIFLIGLHLLPERSALLTISGVLAVHVLDPPQALVLLGHLVHQVIDVVFEHHTR